MNSKARTLGHIAARIGAGRSPARRHAGAGRSRIAAWRAAVAATALFGIGFGAAGGTVAVAAPPLNTCSAADSLASQRYWYFGNKAVVDFGVNGSAPMSSLSPIGGVSEGTTVVTDSTGTLQFWSNGGTVYNRNSVAMPNGTGLLGAPSSTQTVVAFPAIGQAGKYFVVTTDTVTPGAGRLRYSVVDMSLNGGLGDVTATKNVALGLAGTASEALGAVPNDDGTGFWVLTYTPNTSNLLAYEFDGAGPTTASAVTTALSIPQGDGFGSFNTSADLSKIAMVAGVGGASGAAGVAHVLDFNATTGAATDTFAWALPSHAGAPYTGDFSPSGDYVYVSRIFGSPHLWRFKLAGAANSAAVLASEEDLGPVLGVTGGNVRRGPDGKMYEAMNGQAFLGVVNSPDAATAAGANFDNNGFALAATSNALFGLSETVTGCAVPALELTKTANVTTGHVGQPITYTFTVKNNGALPMNGVTINDPLVGTVTCPSATVLPGATMTCSAMYTPTLADLTAGQVTNTATVTGTPQGGVAITSPPVNTTTPVTNSPPVCSDTTVAGTSEQPTVVTLPCTDPDGDALTYSIVSPPPPSAGTVTLTGSQATFTPTEDFEGPVTFTYKATDVAGASSAVKTVTINVTLTCGGMIPTVRGTAGVDRLRATSTRGPNVIVGLGGNDTIDGQEGDDIICGGAGVDSIRGDRGNDTIYGGSGADDLRGDDGDDTMFGGVGADRLRGDNGNDVLRGEAGTDDLEGDSDRDQLFGGADADELDGGLGSPDRCDGEAGTDINRGGCEVLVSLP